MKFSEFLLLEMPMKIENDLPKDVFVIVRKNSTYCEISLINLSTDERNELGKITIMKVVGENFWQVILVGADQNYGPLLYDLAIEIATKYGSGLTADLTGNITQEARYVWERYFYTRKDVKQYSLPEKWLKKRNIEGDEYLGYIYSKLPTRLEKLKQSGKLKDNLEFYEENW